MVKKIVAKKKGLVCDFALRVTSCAECVDHEETSHYSHCSHPFFDIKGLLSFNTVLVSVFVPKQSHIFPLNSRCSRINVASCIEWSQMSSFPRTSHIHKPSSRHGPICYGGAWDDCQTLVLTTVSFSREDGVIMCNILVISWIRLCETVRNSTQILLSRNFRLDV